MGPGADEPAAMRQLEADLAAARAAAKDIAGQLQAAFDRGWAECEACHGLGPDPDPGLGPDAAASPRRGGGAHRKAGPRHLYPVPDTGTGALAGLALAPFAVSGLVARHTGMSVAAASLTIAGTVGVYALAPDMTSPPAVAALHAAHGGGWLDPPTAATRIPATPATPATPVTPAGPAARRLEGGVNAAVASPIPPPLAPTPALVKVTSPAAATAATPTPSSPDPDPSLLVPPPPDLTSPDPVISGSDPAATPSPVPPGRRRRHRGGGLGGILGQPGGRHHRGGDGQASTPTATATPTPSPDPSGLVGTPGGGQ